MKVYAFYIFSNTSLSDYYAVLPNDVKYSHGFSYALYAWTKSKKEAKIFKQTRNMNIFLEKILTMDKETFEQFEETYDDERLDFHHYKGFGMNGEKIQKVYYQVLSITKEYDLVSFYGYDRFEETMSDFDESFIVGLKKIIKSSIYNKIESYFDFENISSYQVPLDEYLWRDYVLNQLEIYNDMFKNTYEEGGVYKNAMLSLL